MSRLSRPPAKGEQSPVILERAAGSALRLRFGSCFIVTHGTEIKWPGALWNNTSFPCPVAKQATPTPLHPVLWNSLLDSSRPLCTSLGNKKPPCPCRCAHLTQHRARGVLPLPIKARGQAELQSHHSADIF